MESKDAVTGAAIAALLAILGVILMVGIILLMMWKQPGIEHSPSQQSRLRATNTALERNLQLPILKACIQSIPRRLNVRGEA